MISMDHPLGSKFHGVLMVFMDYPWISMVSHWASVEYPWLLMDYLLICMDIQRAGLMQRWESELVGLVGIPLSENKNANSVV